MEAEADADPVVPDPVAKGVADTYGTNGGCAALLTGTYSAYPVRSLRRPVVGNVWVLDGESMAELLDADGSVEVGGGREVNDEDEEACADKGAAGADTLAAALPDTLALPLALALPLPPVPSSFSFSCSPLLPETVRVNPNPNRPLPCPLDEEEADGTRLPAPPPPAPPRAPPRPRDGGSPRPIWNVSRDGLAAGVLAVAAFGLLSVSASASESSSIVISTSTSASPIPLEG